MCSQDEVEVRPWGRAALRQAALRIATLLGLALLSWAALDSAPRRDWLRAVGPAVASSDAIGFNQVLGLAGGG